MDDRYGVLAGGGKMGALVRSMDWSKTPLGPIESWPQSLLTTVSLTLGSNFPISIAWGPQRVQIYNDGYWPICAAKHPHSMGQDFKECWLSAWPAIGEPFERATRGETAFLVNQRMFLDRLGYLEETFFTFSFSPIRDATGTVAGLFHPVTELTEQSLAERRLQVLRQLGERSAEAGSIEDAITIAADTLRDCPLDVPFALIYRVGPDGSSAHLAASAGMPPGGPLSPPVISLSSYDGAVWPMRVSERGGTEIVTDLRARLGAAPCGPYDEPPHTAVIQPIRLPGSALPLAFLVAGVSSRRPLDEAYRTFFAMLGEGVTNAFGKAHAYEVERNRAESLAELDRAKTAFFSNISHEFRTPLTLMLGPLADTLANAHGRLPETAAAEITVAHRNALRLLKLVNTLLDFSRIEASRIQASFEPVDLAAFTSELASVFRSACERAGVELVVDTPELPEPVYVDRDMWEKIVLNLLSNAFKFTFEGRISVTLEAADDRVRLAVTDTGVGIPAEELPRVFDRFHRVKDSRGRTHEGTGIGLALVEELAKLHGGNVRAESEEGSGSRFTVEIPRGKSHLPEDRIVAPRTLASTAVGAEVFAEEAMRWLPSDEQRPEGLADTASDAAPAKSAVGGRVLWADDNSDVRQYVARLLRQSGFEVSAVADGLEALDAARHDPPDLVLADVMMPRVDGFELLRRLRDDPATADVPVILLSARAGEEARIEGLRGGADDYLVKPFSAKELVARIEAHIRLSRVRRDAGTALRASEESLAEQRRLYATVTDNATTALFIMDDKQRCVFMNPAAEALTGFAFEETRGRELHDIIHHTRPDGSHYPLSECPIDQAFPQNDREQGEEVFVHKDGRFYPVAFTASPVRDETGSPVGTVIEVRDISAAKAHQEQMRTVMAELNHRVKNTLAVVNAIARQTLRRAANLDSFSKTFEARLQSIAKAHSLLTRTDWEGCSLSEIVHSEIDPRLSSPEQATIDGPPVHLLPKQCLAVHMVIHEMATNAMKYGALKSETGRVEIRWSTERNGDAPWARLEWVERCRQPIGPPGEKGYGSRLIEQSVVYELHGKTESEFVTDGLRRVIRFPIQRASQASDAAPPQAARSKQAAARRVLVAEDNTTIAMALTDELRAMGVEVIGPANTLSAALRLAREQHPTAAILDVDLDGEFVYPVARLLRDKGIPFVLLTGFEPKDIPDDLRSAPVLGKPVQIDRLASLLGSGLAVGKPTG